jgi:hypothetical protein
VVADVLRDRKTVGELVAELSKFPADMPVMVYDFQRGDECMAGKGELLKAIAMMHRE